MMTAEPRPDRTLGPLHDPFWAGCAAGELRLPECTSCGKLRWPPTAACDGCGSAEFTWRTLSGRGKIVSWGSFHQDYYRGVLPVPYDNILVELEEGPLFIAIPDGFGVDDISFGMAVAVAFRACTDSAGPFSLPVFRIAAA